MRNLFYTLILALPLALVSCFGNNEEEIPVKFGSERSELAGSPATLKQVVIDYEGVAPGRKGKTLSEDFRTYDKDGNILTYEIKYTDPDYDDFRQEFTYDKDGNIERYDYSDDEDSYYTVYARKGKLITKAQNYYEGEPTSYYKYTYKGNKETSRSLFSSVGVKLTQTDYTWDGDRVVKEVEQDIEEGTQTVRHIEYPDDNTEIIRVETEGEEYYRVTVKYNDKGDFASMYSVSEDDTTERVYSYEYDEVGNWTKRTVATPDGDLLWIETREFTYHS